MFWCFKQPEASGWIYSIAGGWLPRACLTWLRRFQPCLMFFVVGPLLVARRYSSASSTEIEKMRCFLVVILCFLTAATSQALQTDASSDSIQPSRVGDLKRDFSAMAQSGWSWINSMRENYGPIAVEAIEKTRQT